MQMVSKLDMPLPLFLCLGRAAGFAGPPCCPANPDSTFPVSISTPQSVKVESNTTCKSSISQVSLPTHPVLSSNEVAISGSWALRGSPATTHLHKWLLFLYLILCKKEISEDYFQVLSNTVFINKDPY